MNSELLKHSSDVFANVMSSSDEVSAADLVDPFAPDMIFGVPPSVLFGCFEEVEPPFDHMSRASEHRGPICNMELTIGKTLVSRFEVKIAWVQELVCFREFQEISPPSNGLLLSCGQQRCRRLPGLDWNVPLATSCSDLLCGAGDLALDRSLQVVHPVLAPVELARKDKGWNSEYSVLLTGPPPASACLFAEHLGVRVGKDLRSIRSCRLGCSGEDRVVTEVGALCEPLAE